MSDQDARAKNFAFNYQSDIFNQKAPVKTNRIQLFSQRISAKFVK